MSNIQQANQQLSDALRKIDQLTQANQQLTQQNNQLTQDLNKEKTTNQHLKSVNDKKEEEMDISVRLGIFTRLIVDTITNWRKN